MQLQDHVLARSASSGTEAWQHFSINRLHPPGIRLIRLGEKRDPGSALTPDCSILSHGGRRRSDPNPASINSADAFQIVTLHLAFGEIIRKPRILKCHAAIERSVMARHGRNLPLLCQQQRNPRVWIRIVGAQAAHNRSRLKDPEPRVANREAPAQPTPPLFQDPELYWQSECRIFLQRLLHLL